jgi:hypothetical protein
METDALGRQHAPHHPHPHAHEVEFFVNKKPVHMTGHRHKGIEIKDAAIAQGVKIQRDFLLFLEHEHQPNKPIGDDEEVTINKHSRFKAIGDDDNS